MSMTTPKEQRRLPRVEADLTAERHDGERLIVDRVLNLSISGLMVLTQHPLSVGASVSLRLCDAEPAIALSAEVVWVRRSERWPGVEAGLKLLGLDAETLAQLELLMTRLLVSRQGRRSSVRFSVAIAAQWRAAGEAQPLNIELIDLSLGGAMITGARVPQYAERGLLSLDIGDGVMATAASVVWRDIHRVPAASGLSFDPGPAVSGFVAKVVRTVLLAHGDESPESIEERLATLFDGVDPEQTDRVPGLGRPPQ